MSNVVRQKIRDAFAALRAAGYWTLEGDICCQSCGLAMVPDAQAEAYCFYHCQDEDMLYETGSCCLSWAGDAALIVFELEAAGLLVEWNGRSSGRIEVKDNPAIPCCSEPMPSNSDEHDMRTAMMRAVRNGLMSEAKARKH